jgi:thiol-disulfide isomerase/thioredoxin
MLKKWLLALGQFALLSVLLLTLLGLWQQRHLPKGEAPVLSGVSLDGAPVSTADARGRAPVLLYFWATWCPYCDQVSRAVDAVAGDYSVISVALRSGTDARVRAHMLAEGLQFPVLNDPVWRLGEQWGVQVTPTLIVLDANGRVSKVTTGLTSEWGLRWRLWRSRHPL